MTIYIDGHSFGYELRRVAQLFFFGEKVELAEGMPESLSTGVYLYTLLEGVTLTVHTRIYPRAGGILDGQEEAFDLTKPVHSRISETMAEDSTPVAIEHQFGVLLYHALSEITGLKPPWGVLTGIRPVKLVLSQLEQGLDGEALRRHFVEGCLLDEGKYTLALETARIEREILARSTPDSFSLYVSIPFCPTRCAYCSFVSHAVEQAAKLIPAYVDRLCEELAYTARIAAGLKLKLRTVYFGGGTPTTLSAEQLRRVMEVIAAEFDLSALWEYTVEAGRPDTITAEKLRVIKAAGAQRISINPQTLSDSVLAEIGRKHTTKELLDAFALARDCGFDNINMDLIAGLPTDTAEGFRRSIDGVIALTPENITVHTLTVKRASRLQFEEARDELALVSGMVDYARASVKAEGFAPYYLYRQTGSLSGLENVGYAKPGTEGLYNVYIMDETHSILAVGAGASTKLRHPVTGALLRLYNYKFPYEYIEHFDTIKTRKDQIAEFYR